MTAPEELDLKALREKAEAATPGPWSAKNVFDALNDFARHSSNPRADRVWADCEFSAAFNPAVALAILSRIDSDAKTIEGLRKRDDEAATYVETVICMRTGFTGDPPYVGWKGLGLALTEALDERDAALAENTRLRKALVPFAHEAAARAQLVLGPDIDHWPIGGSALTLGDLRRARAALKQGSDADAEQ